MNSNVLRQNQNQRKQNTDILHKPCGDENHHGAFVVSGLSRQRIKIYGGYRDEKKCETQHHSDRWDQVLCGKAGELPHVLLLEEPQGRLHSGKTELLLPGRGCDDRARKDMLVQFTVENYRSIKTSVVISFVASKDMERIDDNIRVSLHLNPEDVLPIPECVEFP